MVVSEGRRPRRPRVRMSRADTERPKHLYLRPARPPALQKFHENVMLMWGILWWRSPCAKARSGKNGGADGTRTRPIQRENAALARVLSRFFLVVLLPTACGRSAHASPHVINHVKALGFNSCAGFSSFALKGKSGGADGTRTRDLSRDRRAF